MNKYLIIVMVLVLIYLAVIMIVYTIQGSLMFHPTKLRKDYQFRSEFNFQEVFLSTSDHVEINGLFFNAKSEKVILYFHGNAGNLDSWSSVYNDLQPLGYNFFIIDYRGYGKSSGVISEEGLYIDAQTAYEYLLRENFKEENIIVYGRSLGTGIAVDLIEDKKVNSIILESPYTSFSGLVSEKAPYLFPSLYLKYELNSLKKIENINTPMLVIHGKRDELIPFEHGEKIYNNYKGKKVFLPIEGGTHNNLSEFSELTQGISTFLSQQ